MALRSKKSILFVRPDFHCSFFYCNEFRKQGWNADIFVQSGYPEKLLYSSSNVLRFPQFTFSQIFPIRVINFFIFMIFWLKILSKYKYHFYYGSSPVIDSFERLIKLDCLFGKGFSIEFFLAKLFRVKLLCVPTGCLEDDLKSTWQSFDDGNVCGNCGFHDRCSDDVNKIKFMRLRRYFDFFVGFGFKNSREFKETHFKYKVIDLNLWNPNLKIPLKFRLSKTKKLRILHSNFLKNSGRDYKNRNIKGTPHILAAMERLVREGHPVEYLNIENVDSKNMRFYQAQADIVVDQLIFGSWGSTCVECLALGKPVVCYLRPSVKDFFLKNFPEYDSLPIVEADTKSIYHTLKKLVTDDEFRNQQKIASREFAESHFDGTENTRDLIEHLQKI